MEGGAAIAVGSLSPGGAWFGFEATDEGYALCFGEPDGRRRRAPRTDAHDLLNLALAYFGDGAHLPPDDLQATHGDVADLVRWLADAARDEPAHARLRAAVDAIDDGLAADAVMLCLAHAAQALAPRTGGEQADAVDPVDLLAERYRVLEG